MLFPSFDSQNIVKFGLEIKKLCKFKVTDESRLYHITTKFDTRSWRGFLDKTL